MLVLTRKKEESIMIGHDIEITVLSIEGEQIKLGIEAPKHIDIHRKEIYLSIQHANKEASSNFHLGDILSKFSKREKGEKS